MLAFLVIVLHSKHLHIFSAPINVIFKRLPDGLGPLLPVEYDGKPIDFENPPDDAQFGRGKIEDFSWKAHARLRHLHRVRALPVAVPGLEHRQAALAQARHHGPARPLDGQGALHPG